MLAPELKLLADCCRASFATGGSDLAGETAGYVDWGLFFRLARRHRVQGLAHHGLSALQLEPPPEVADSLASEARAVAGYGLQCAAESAKLLRAFDTAGVPIVFLKGLTLGALAYGNTFLKAGWDIDLLVSIDRVAEARSLLIDAGYEQIIPRGDANLRSWHAGHKESVWRNASGLYVELHTSLADHPRLLPHMGVQSPVHQVAVASGVVLPTLATDELFAYLCVHGASSAWFRLKWIADLAGLIAGCSAAEVARLHAVSQTLGAGRAAGQALLLAHRFFDAPIIPALHRQLQSDRIVRWLAAAATKQILAVREPTQRFLGTATIHLTQLNLLPGVAFPLSEGRRQIMSLLS